MYAANNKKGFIFQKVCLIITGKFIVFLIGSTHNEK